MSHYHLMLLDETYANVELLANCFRDLGISFSYCPTVEALKIEDHDCIFIVCSTVLYPKLEQRINEMNAISHPAIQCLYIIILGKPMEVQHIKTSLYRMADDYILAPIIPELVAAKCHALARRHTLFQTQFASKMHCLRFDDLLIDPSTKTMILKGKMVNLTLTEFNIVYTLASHPLKTYSMDYLFTLITGQKSLGDYNAIMTHISRIRKKIASADPSHKYIVTVRNHGYCFNEKSAVDPIRASREFELMLG